MSLLSGHRSVLRCFNLGLQRQLQSLYQGTRQSTHASFVDITTTEQAKAKRRKKKNYVEVIEVTGESATQKRAKVKKYDTSALGKQPPTIPAAAAEVQTTEECAEHEEFDEPKKDSVTPSNLLPKKKVGRTKKTKKELEKELAAQQEIISRKKREKQRLEYFLAVMDVLTGQRGQANAALAHFRTFRRRGGMDYDADQLTSIYNGVLRCVAKIGDIDPIKTVLKMMREDKAVPDFKTFRHCFETIGRYAAFESSRNMLTETSTTLIADLPTYNLDLQSVFRNRDFEYDERERTLAGIRYGAPNFVPEYDPLDTRYQCSLVNRLNENRTDGEIHSTIDGVLNPEDVRHLVQGQIKVEESGSLTVKSVAKDVKTKDSAAAKEALEAYEKSWEISITSVLKRQLQIMKRRYATADPTRINISAHGADACKSWVIYPFLSAIPLSELSELVLKEVRQLLAGSSSFSPPLCALEQEMGQKFVCSFIRNRRKSSKLDTKLMDFQEQYVKRLLQPQVGEVLNPRQIWEEIEYANMSGPDVGTLATPWPEWLIAHIGEYLFKLIIDDVKFDAKRQSGQSADMLPAFYIVYRLKGAKYFREIKVHPLLKKLNAEAVSRDLTFDYSILPMVVPPMPWLKYNVGGYLTAGMHFIRAETGLKTLRLAQSKPEKLYPISDSLNALGLVPWKVNQRILDIIIEIFNNNGSEDLGIPVHPGSLKAPECNYEEAEAHEKPLIFREMSLYKKQKAELLSMWCAGLFALSIANHFRDKIFWSPQNMDFRGRVYPMPPHLNHLQSDYGRALLLFGQGRPLGESGLKWLKLHAINLTGNMKRKSISERLTYMESIVDEIVDCAENPFSAGKKWWQNSDDPWQTLACCMEIEQALKSSDPKKYVSHLPIHQDGSCNGLQHYAALGRDAIGARSVNLAANEVPGDVYSDVAALVECQRRQDAEQGNYTAKVLEGFVSRKVVKQTVMTIVYGVTRLGARLQIMRQLKEINEFPNEEASKASNYLAEKTFDCIREMFTSAREIQDWFNDCARVIAGDCGQHIEWVTPLGLPVVQTYSNGFSGKTPNSVKHRNAFAPNFVHSLDSCHMMMTSLFSQRAGITFASVHDCFWTHPCSVEVMSKICRDSFVGLHSEPILENLSEFFQSHYDEPYRQLVENSKSLDPRKLGVFTRVPNRADFDLEEVKRSAYFFS